MLRLGRPGWTAFVVMLGLPIGAAAQSPLAGDTLHIVRASGPIVVDGVLDDEVWTHAARVDTWYETNPGDNSVPSVASQGYLAYDDRFLYAAFELQDPEPSSIRSPYADHDHLSGNSTDYAGLILDTRHDGHSAVLLLASATGIQYDAITDDDGSGEDSSPDFFWESAARISAKGWILEVRVPFSSLRYRKADPQTWGILLYRNYPRAFRYQYFSAKLPRGGNCFICRANTLVGLERLPGGGHIVAAPYASASETARPVAGLGSRLDNEPIDGRVGLDLKWTPTADTALDFTLNPDFSQIEADTAQISANERFALSFPEKRPFFLEGVELFSTPIRAVYTRAITSPRWGARATGKQAGLGYTVLVSDDEGGGSVVVPGPNGSAQLPQSFGSTVVVARAKRSIGRHFVSAIVTDREGRDGGGFNRVAGPDLQWRPSSSDTVTAQYLVSRTREPNRPDLASQWRGQGVDGSAASVQWARNTRHFDLTTAYRDFTDGFRADSGFVPQVGYWTTSWASGWTVRPKGFLSRQRTFATYERQEDQHGEIIGRSAVAGVGMDTRFSGFMQFRYFDDRVRAGASLFERRRFGYVAQFSPTRRIARVSVDGTTGQEVDFDNARLGRGTSVNLNAQLNPTDHLELALLQNQRWLDDTRGGARQRLFTARVSRVRATYSFNARSFVRLIGQYVATDRDPSLYLADVRDRSGTFSGSVLLAYKINWQSVLFVGYGDDRELSATRELEQADRQLFVKVSYAFQR